jgi:hypothetical protein
MLLFPIHRMLESMRPDWSFDIADNALCEEMASTSSLVPVRRACSSATNDCGSTSLICENKIQLNNASNSSGTSDCCGHPIASSENSCLCFRGERQRDLRHRRHTQGAYHYLVAASAVFPAVLLTMAKAGPETDVFWSPARCVPSGYFPNQANEWNDGRS